MSTPEIFSAFLAIHSLRKELAYCVQAYWLTKISSFRVVTFRIGQQAWSGGL